MLLKCVNLGVDGYNLKPIESEMVESVLSQAVSRLRLHQQSLKEAQLWQQTFDAVPDMVAVLDRNFNLLRLNDAARRLLGV
jgi:PAS domain-containing protein